VRHLRLGFSLSGGLLGPQHARLAILLRALAIGCFPGRLLLHGLHAVRLVSRLPLATLRQFGEWLFPCRLERAGCPRLEFPSSAPRVGDFIHVFNQLAWLLAGACRVLALRPTENPHRSHSVGRWLHSGGTLDPASPIRGASAFYCRLHWDLCGLFAVHLNGCTGLAVRCQLGRPQRAAAVSFPFRLLGWSFLSAGCPGERCIIAGEVAFSDGPAEVGYQVFRGRVGLRLIQLFNPAGPERY